MIVATGRLDRTLKGLKRFRSVCRRRCAGVFGSYLEGIETGPCSGIYPARSAFGSYLEGIETVDGLAASAATLVFGSYLEGIETGNGTQERRTVPCLDRTLKGLKPRYWCASLCSNHCVWIVP